MLKNNIAAWQPSASIEILKKRAKAIKKIRDFFELRGVLEVFTPLLGSSTTSTPAIDSFVTNYIPAGEKLPSRQLFLQTSPEYPMKRLLAAGSGPIYQLGPVFRNGEVGKKHQPEFWMLEWYRPGWVLSELIQEISDLLQEILGCNAIVIFSYQSVFERLCDFNPHEITVEQLVDRALAYNLINTKQELILDKDGWLDMFMTHLIEPKLTTLSICPIVITDYPASQAALAQIIGHVGARFEVYYQNIELANGYLELTDSKEQQARFEVENQMRLDLGLQAIPLDKYLLDALDVLHTMPPTSGVALGVDRLLMLALGVDTIQAVQAFDFERC